MTWSAITRIGLPILVLLAVAACSPFGARDASVDLAGTSWVLSSLGGALPLPGTAVTLQFGADGSASGTDGCNQFSTTYTQRGDRLTIQQPAASTLMACAEPVMTQATAYMAALAATTRYDATERELALRDGNRILATFVSSSSGLAGTDWEVISYNNGQEAVVGLLLGTTISASFGADGKVSGNAGCNRYFAGYSVDGNTIEIGPPGATRRYCPAPEGVMEQEVQYLTALQSAATYSIQGTLLEMRTAADQIAVVMQRQLALDLPGPEPAPGTPTGLVVAPQGTNVYSGPGADYPVIGLAQTGDEGTIVGRSADGLWWAASIPSAPDGVGWVSAYDVVVTNAENVPVLGASPTVAVPPVAPPALTPTSPPPAATAAPPAPAATQTSLPPTATPTSLPPSATPSAEISFWADQTSIQQGECTLLHWSVKNVQAVWVYPRGADYQNFPQTGESSQQVCPPVTTTFEMRVLQLDGATVFREVTISVAVPALPTALPPTPVANPLAGTRWEVVNYNNGQGAVVNLILGTRISLDFGVGAQVSGNSGCNDYTAAYQVDGPAMTIGQPSSTSMFCAEPEGVMDQEAQFLAALQSAAAFRIEGNTLEMRTASGALAIIAARAP
jgi:heat shock protein HslJ/uncharacterized protein YraI